MLVTINTDASFHGDYKVGAFAFWSVCNEFKIMKAMYLQDLCKNPDEAEIRCILNALHNTLNQPTKLTRAIINTDSLNSIAVFKNDKRHINRYNLKLWKKYRVKYHSIIQKSNNPNVKIEFRHVKAHTGKNDARSYVNEWCDRNAKVFLWRRINQIKKNNGI